MFPLVIIAIFVWVGFVAAISFMEAWLKFRAPGVNLEIGLGIGKLVFKALNRVEIGLATVMLVLFYFHYLDITLSSWIISTILIVILAFQSFILLPKLTAAAQLKMEGVSDKKSPFHIYFVVTELIKVTLLIVLGTQLLNAYIL